MWLLVTGFCVCACAYLRYVKGEGTDISLDGEEVDGKQVDLGMTVLSSSLRTHGRAGEAEMIRRNH